MTLQTISYAPDAWKLLSGFFCIYKPSNIRLLDVRKIIIGNLCRDLNDMEVRPPTDYVKIEGSVTSGQPLTVTTVPNLADHPLVVGPRYQQQDVKMTWVTHVGKVVSGVVVMCVNGNHKTLARLQEANHLRTYEIRGEFGRASDSLRPTGRIIEKATYRHVTVGKLERLLATIQAAHQAQAFNYAGVRMDSQTAYDLAATGDVRPAGKSPTLIYGLRCIDFSLPYFTLELTCINEHQSYLMQLVNDIGLKLRTCALCHQVRQTRYGHFGLDHALLRKHWNLEHILQNIQHCRPLLTSDKIMPPSPHFVESSSMEVHTKNTFTD
ncbi:pseudouridylate synthase TRUB2, mitochondrial-like [Ornithodoros turicata]|uniref:pseudouridylate synthase TRUB2, mitochondrial-like n=1 Tax=Ornithodoros turicata TaxID=34597 RepID=UPI003138EE00